MNLKKKKKVLVQRMAVEKKEKVYLKVEIKMLTQPQAKNVF